MQKLYNYLFSTGVKEVFQLDNITMLQSSHNLKFSVLKIKSCSLIITQVVNKSNPQIPIHNLISKEHQLMFSYRTQATVIIIEQLFAGIHLKPFVLEHLLDGDELARVAQLGLVDDAEAAIADELHVGIAHLLGPVGPLPRRRHHGRHLRAVFTCNTTHLYITTETPKLTLNYTTSTPA